MIPGDNAVLMHQTYPGQSKHPRFVHPDYAVVIDSHGSVNS
jgi:hypothetical protein